MSKAQRTDAHRPSALVPEDYDFVDFFGHIKTGGLDCQDYPEMIYFGEEALRDYQDNPVGVYEERQCDICGARFVHGAVLWHKPSKGYISIGQDCGEKFLAMNRMSHRQKQDIKWAGIRAHQAKTRLRPFLKANPGLVRALKADHDITRDMRSKLVQRGELSDKQIAFAWSLKQQADELYAFPPAPEPEAVPIPADVLNGRTRIRGTVLGTKAQDGYMGGTVLKMLLRVDADGGAFKLWGTVPDALFDLITGELRGSVIEITARVNASDDDPAFGFISRPTKPAVIEQGE